MKGRFIWLNFMKFKECKIVAGMFHNMVMVKTNESYEWAHLFSYFPDELIFAQSEFIGLTAKQAYQLFHEKIWLI